MNEQEKMQRKIDFIEQNSEFLKDNILTKIDEKSNLAENLVIVLNDDRDIIEIKEYYKILKLLSSKEKNNCQNFTISICEIFGILKYFLGKSNDNKNISVIKKIDSYIELEENHKVLKKVV